jgi:diguanylate cyclase (GGDEF)-like protein
MWKIDNRFKFLLLLNSFKNEYALLAFYAVATVIILGLNFGYIPTLYLIGAILVFMVIFLLRWKNIDLTLTLDDEDDNLPTASRALRSHLIWLGVGSIFISLVSFYSIKSMPTDYQYAISAILVTLVVAYSISLFSFWRAFLIFALPIEIPLLTFLFTQDGIGFQALGIFNVLAMILVGATLGVKSKKLKQLSKQKLEIEEHKKQINKEAQNLQKYIDLLDEVDIGTVIVDNKNRIVYYSVTLQKWFNISKNMSFDRFFASIIRDVNELNKKEIVAKSGRSYRVASTIIEDIDNDMYYLKVFKDITKEYKYSKSSFRESIIRPEADEYDKLTQLLNRPAFSKYLNQTIYEADITNTKTALMIISVNDFQYISETYSQKVADEIIRILAKRLKNSTRDSDLVGKYGASEFIVSLKLIEDLDIVELIAKKILKNLIKPFRVIDDKDIFITVSIGISIYPDDTKDLTKLEHQAYQALKEVKKEKKSGYILYRDTIHSQD